MWLFQLVFPVPSLIFFCLKAQVSDIAWLALASACFPKRNKNGIKIWPQWDSCRTWQAAPQATIVEIKQILEQSCIREREIDSYLATTDIAEHAIWIWTLLSNFRTSANGISKLLFPQIAKEWLKRSWSVKLYTILK